MIALFKVLGQPVLLALDLIDRGVVTRVGGDGYSYYLIDGRTGVIEVRLGNWHCSCPHFAVSSFVSQPSLSQMTETGDGVWGGRRHAKAYCKHLIACLFLEHGKSFKTMRKETEFEKR